MSIKLKVFLTRFLKGFAAGGLAQVALVINGGVTISNITELQSLLTVVVSGFISGGILAVIKMMTWKEYVIEDFAEIDSVPLKSSDLIDDEEA